MSLYQKIRPPDFDQIVGNTVTVKALRGWCRNAPADRNHALLFEGPVGCGKTTLARIVAGVIGADAMSLQEKNAANTRGIDTVREIVNSIAIKAISGKPKVIIFDESHQLTNAAQEGLLKDLEDYPDDVYFIFCTTAPENLTRAIRSRCTRFPVQALVEREIHGLLQTVCARPDVRFDVSNDILKAIAHMSNGLPRNAVVTLEKCMLLDDELDMFDSIVAGTDADPHIFELCKILIQAPELRKERWQDAVKQTYILSGESESIRRAIITFIGRKMEKCPKREIMDDYAWLVRKFSYSTLYHGKSMLATLVYEACIGGSNA